MSLPSLRAVLLAAIGGPALAACAPSPDDPNDKTDLTETVVPDPDSGEVDTGTTVVPCADGVVIPDAEGNPSGYVSCPDGAVLRIDTHTWSDDGLCSTDADCDSGQVCIGDELAGRGGAASYCITASCETGSDCDTGECGLSTYDDGCGLVAELHCRTEEDACRGDLDCSGSGDQCVVTYWSEAAWVCAGYDCAIGRPLVAGEDGGQPITAGMTASSAQVVPLPGLDPHARGALAAWWAHVAQLEHASVASFARVTLELMSLGAPASILHAVQRAADDEIRHAESAFALASRFAGVRLRPGKLPTAGVAPRQGAQAILEGLIHEACVGETVGVAEAQAALDGCTDPLVRQALTDIVADETRHAALAWRTLAWLLQTHPELHASAEAAFAKAVTDLWSSGAPALPHVPAWGMLGDSARAKVRENALMSVVLPCAQQTLAQARSQRPAQPRVSPAGPGAWA